MKRNLISWFSKKKSFIALSTTEVEYVAAGSYCAKILWIKHQLEDYGVKLGKMPIKYGNNSVINLSKNLVLHSWTKHIDARHHFIKDQVSNGTVFLDSMCIEN